MPRNLNLLTMLTLMVFDVMLKMSAIKEFFYLSNFPLRVEPD